MKNLSEGIATRADGHNLLRIWWVSYAVVPVLVSVMAAIFGMHLLPDLRLLGNAVFSPAPVGFFLLSIASFVVVLGTGAIGTYQVVISKQFPTKEIFLGLAGIVIACLLAPALAFPFTRDGLVEQESKGGTANVQTECLAMTGNYVDLYADGFDEFGQTYSLLKDSLDPRLGIAPVLVAAIAVPVSITIAPIGMCPASFGGYLLPWLLLLSFVFTIVLPFVIRTVNNAFPDKSILTRIVFTLGVLLAVWVLWGIALAMGLDRTLQIGSSAKAEARCEEHRTTRTQPYVAYDAFMTPHALADIAALVDETGIEVSYFTVDGPTESGNAYVYPTGVPRGSGTNADMLRASFVASTTALYATDVRGVESVSADTAAAIAGDLDAGKAVVTGFKFSSQKTDGSTATWSDLYAYYAKYDRELHWFKDVATPGQNRTAPVTYTECYP